MAMPKRVYLETHGCTANRADSDIMAALLERAGYELVDSPEKADAIILNTCNVKKPTEDRMVHRAKVLSARGVPLIVAGCMALTQPYRLRQFALALVGPKSIHRIVEAVEGALEGRRVQFLDRTDLDKSTLPRRLPAPLSAPFPIAEGCVGACSYCITRFARGRLRSYTPASLVRLAEELISAGAIELLVTAQDVAAYGLDIGTSLPELLEMLLEIPGNYRVRLGMMNPNTLSRIVDELLRAMSDPRVYKFLHIPVQSGSDAVLKLMNRGYTVADFLGLVKKFRSAFRETTLATDVIVGFPGEGDEDFEATVKLLEEAKPEVVNISRFGPRPGTPAARMTPLPPQVVKRRSKILVELVREIGLRANEKFVGKELTVLALEKTEKGYQGRTDFYRAVAIMGEDVRLGRFCSVEIDEARPNYLVGRIISELDMISGAARLSEAPAINRARNNRRLERERA